MTSSAPVSAMSSELERHGILVFERGWLSSNNVLLLGDAHRGAVVVDTGYWTHGSQTVALLRHALAGAPLARVLNTHLHSDHCGGNAAVQSSFGAPIDIPAGECMAVDAWDMALLSYEATGQHCPRFTRSGVLDVQRDVAAGRWDWQVLAAPGHDPLSVALYQPELGVLISADALWENGFGVVFPELVGEPGFDDVRRTLESFAALDVRCVIPGHGRAFTDVRGALERAFRRVDAFAQDPHRHAEHAAKVLLKFRLLETQAETWDSLARWVQSATYFELLRSRYFPALGLTEWLRLLADDLAARGALSVSTDRVANI